MKREAWSVKRFFLPALYALRFHALRSTLYALTRCGAARGLAALCALGCAVPALALINPDFTPVDLVKQSDLILAATIRPGADALSWKWVAVETLKGKEDRAEGLVSLAFCKPDQAENVRRLFLGQEGRDPAVLFSAASEKGTRALLHVGGVWLAVQVGKSRAWVVQGLAPQTSSVYAGGTDMLVRMSRYIVAHPDATVPTGVGTRWTGRTRVGAFLGGDVAGPALSGVEGMAPIELKSDGETCLFVASSQGDRVYRPVKGQDHLEDVTAETRLDTRSRRFAWVDLDRDGLADLVSWDGRAIEVRLARRDGTFAPAGRPWPLKLSGECLGLAAGDFRFPISDFRSEMGNRQSAIGNRGVAGAPGILVSTDGAPFLLDARGRRTELPSGDAVRRATGRPAACLVADLDNDGFADILQPREGDTGGLAPSQPGEKVPVPLLRQKGASPREGRSLLWKGRAGATPSPSGRGRGEGASPSPSGRGKGEGASAFHEPELSPVSTAGGGAALTLGDFDGDGFLDLFLSGRQSNQLWENDGKGGFRDVAERAGSLGYKTPPGVADCMATDLNHDGRPDLALCYPDAGLLYHFNRGFRCFGEEGELRLSGPAFADGPAALGAKACAVADFNGDGGLDFAVAFAGGEVYCYYNDLCDVPGLAVRLKAGDTGPVTVSVWQGGGHPFCTGTWSVTGHTPARLFPLRHRGECSLRYTLPGKSPQTRKLTVGDEIVEVVIGE